MKKFKENKETNNILLDKIVDLDEVKFKEFLDKFKVYLEKKNANGNIEEFKGFSKAFFVIGGIIFGMILGEL